MKNRIILLLSVVCLLGFAACEGDGDADYGYCKIYMPQAVSTGGLDNSYTVPSGEEEYTYNFAVREDRVEVMLGVSRSGKRIDTSGFSVEVYVDNDKTAEAVETFDGEAMPADCYSLPASVSVPDNKSGETFYLSIPVGVLKAPEHAGKIWVLAVGIRNPTRYDLAETGTITVVIVRVDELKALI